MDIVLDWDQFVKLDENTQRFNAFLPPGGIDRHLQIVYNEAMTTQMTDFEKLKIALANMSEAEGKNATNQLMWRSLRASDARVYDMAQELSEKVCQAQHELGVQNTSCGVKMGSEILAKIGMLRLHLEEKGG